MGKYNPSEAEDTAAIKSDTTAIKAKTDNLPTKIEIEIGFPTSESLNNISTTGEQITTEKNVTLSLPSGVTLKEATLIASIIAINNSANTQKIDITVQARKGAGSFTNYFSQDDILGFPASDAATTAISTLSNITTLVDDLSATYGFQCSVNQSSATSVRYTIQYILIIRYRIN